MQVMLVDCRNSNRLALALAVRLLNSVQHESILAAMLAMSGAVQGKVQRICSDRTLGQMPLPLIHLRQSGKLVGARALCRTVIGRSP